MALPIIPLLVFVVVFILFLWRRNTVLSILREGIVDFFFALLFTTMLYLIIRIPTNDIAYVVLFFTFIIFAWRIYSAPTIRPG